jgi:hypothetical protein
MYIHLFRWGKKKHTTRSSKWIVSRYFKSVKPDPWVFGIILPSKNTLKKPVLYSQKNHDTKIWIVRHSSVGIKRDVKVQGLRSPYDGDWEYWSQRLSNYKLRGIPTRRVAPLGRSEATQSSLSRRSLAQSLCSSKTPLPKLNY